MWGKYLRGTNPKNCGSRWFLPFLLAFSLFSASSLSAQTVQQTTPLEQYSKMTREALLTRIIEQDGLLNEWLVWSEKEKALKLEQEKASADQIASRDKLIRDQGVVISAYKDQQNQPWIDKGEGALVGFATGFLTGHFIK